MVSSATAPPHTAHKPLCPRRLVYSSRSFSPRRWTFGQQQALFTGAPVVFIFPWGVTAAVVLASAGLAVLAAAAPARRLLRRPITGLLRSAG